MLTKLFAGLVAVVGLSGASALPASTSSCCYPGSECCFPGSPCCADCCTTGSDCCFPGSPCCEAAVGSCCDLGSPCCVPGAACCATFAADTAPALRAKAEGKVCCQPDQPVKADPPAKLDPKTTKLAVDGMTCAGCARTVTKALAAVEGVEAVVIDLKAKTATVTPKAGKSPAPKDLWEAVEKAEYKPTKLEGPDGTFEKKPTK